jgi:glycosyltransferase involved in cell wall biosynthesis
MAKKSSWKTKDEKPKIAIFHCGFIYTGGGERIVLEEISGLRKRGYEVDCFVPTYDSTLSYPDIIDDFGIKTFLPQLPKSIPLRFAIQIVTSCVFAPFLAFRFKKYDIFLGANQPGAYMAWVISNLLKKPYFVYLSQPNRVLYARDHEDWQNVVDYYVLNKVINKLIRKPVKYLDKRSITESENLFINGSFVAKEINRVYKPKKWFDCPGGAHTPDESIIKADRMKGSIKVDGHRIKKPYILYTSRHEPWKRFDWAVETVNKVIKKHPDVRFVIPGDETTVTPKLKKLAKKLGIEEKVIFTGPITQKSLWRLYQNAAVYIFTSPKEDLGIVVQEAQAAGVPVVAWNSGGPTVTVSDKNTGFLVEPYYLNKMAERITYLLNNPQVRNKMGKAAWKHISDNFSWGRHVDILEKSFLQYI